MKKWVIVFIIALTALPWVVCGFLPEDDEPLGTEEAGPGKRWFKIDVSDPCGNYEGNFLRMKFYGDIDDLELAGLHWDPNYAPWLIVDNAIPDTNDPNETLEGHFWFSKVWKPSDNQIGFQVADSNTNTDCKWGTIIIRDKGRPKVKSISKSQGVK